MKVFIYRFDEDTDIDVVDMIIYDVDRVFFDRRAKQLVIYQHDPIRKQVVSLESDYITGFLVEPDDISNEDSPF